jgi:pyruvate dehydrogenase E2 component (dihydrolipoamide acetyltransferase)
MNAAAGLVEVRVPDMGNFKDVAIIDVLVKPGEKIEPEAPLVTLETEKATMDVPSTVGGVVEKIHIAKGGTVSTGDLIVTVRSEGAAAEAAAGEASAGGNAAGVSAAGGSPGAGSLGSGGLGGGASLGSAGSAAGGGAPAPGGTGAASGAGSFAGSPNAGAAAAGHASQATGGAPQAAYAGPTQARSAGAAQGAPATAQFASTLGQSAAGQTASAPAQPGPGGAASSAAPNAGTAASGGRPASAASVAGAPSGGPSGAASARSDSAGSQAAAASAQPVAGSGQTSAGQSPAHSGNGAGPAQIIAGRPDLPPINEPGFSRAHAGPSVRRFARELGVDLTQVKGGGFKGRVTHDDVKAFVKKFLAAGAGAGAGAKPAPAVAKSAPGTGAPPSFPAVPVVDFSQFGPIETKPLSRIQKISGPRLHASWVNIPHVTQFDEADITELEDTRTQLKQTALQAGIKLTPLAFIVRACVKALQEFPLFNSSLDPNGANLILKKYIHVGFAADTPNGLVVPVVRDANRKDIYEIARQLGELSEKARAGKLLAGEMQGGSFTISSLGGIGGTAFTPIINAPEVAILGVSRSVMKPVFRDGAFVPRLILPLSLSYDHRVIDGASAARFTTFLAQTLADPRALTEAVP